MCTYLCRLSTYPHKNRSCSARETCNTKFGFQAKSIAGLPASCSRSHAGHASFSVQSCHTLSQISASERVPRHQHYGSVALLAIGHGLNYAVCVQQIRFMSHCVHVFGHVLPRSHACQARRADLNVEPNVPNHPCPLVSGKGNVAPGHAKQSTMDGLDCSENRLLRAQELF